jgi:hypothetical protein
MKRLTSDFVRTLACSAWLCSVSNTACAKELDQFTDRLLELRYYAGGYRQIAGAPGPKQVDGVLDQRMNALLDQLQTELQDSPPRLAAEREELVRETFQHRLVAELVTPYEEWVKHEAAVPLYKVRDKGIFGHAVDYDDMRLTWYIELSPIVQVGGVLMGIDKLGHFLAQGFQYYERYQQLSRTLPEGARYAALRAFGHAQEAGQLGIATGGVYSFADLAANWSGLLFFLALFDSVNVEGQHHDRYFERAADGRLRRVRDFHWAEWVTPDWDEALNPAGVARRALYDKVAENFRRRPGPSGQRKSICDWFRQDPNTFLGPNQSLRPRASYALPIEGKRVAPYPLDVRVLCGSAQH